jgi:hypothetical protein
MKKILLSTALAFATTLTYSQKLLKPEIDKISGDTTWSTSSEALFAKVTLVGANEIVGLQPKKLGLNTYVTYLSIMKPKTAQPYGITEGSKLYLKFTDKSLLTLQAFKDNLIEKTGTNTSTFGSVAEGTITYTIYALTKDQLNKLSTDTIEFARIESTAGNMDYDVKPKNAEKVQKAFALIKSK